MCKTIIPSFAWYPNLQFAQALAWDPKELVSYDLPCKFRIKLHCLWNFYLPSDFCLLETWGENDFLFIIFHSIFNQDNKDQSVYNQN